MQDLDAYLSGAQHLPAAPRIWPELLRLLTSSDIDSSRVVQLLELDPGLTAGVLRLSNSAFFGSSQPAADLQEAVTRLGCSQVLVLVATVSGSAALSPRLAGYGLRSGELWQHSVVSALAAEVIARAAGDDSNAVFAAALVHDIGKTVLSDALCGRSHRLVEETEKNGCSMRECEKRLLGVEHAEIGGRLLARWKFPAEVVAAVWHHHDPAAAGPYRRLAAHLYLGNVMAHSLGYCSGLQSFALRGRAEAFSILGLNPGPWPRFLISTWEKLQAMRPLLHAEAG